MSVPLCFLTMCLVFASCGTVRRGHIISEEGSLARVDWNMEELQSGMAIRHLRTTHQASYHVIRLRTSESPHVHEEHDLTVFLLAGKARVFIGGRMEEMETGDVVEIPRGVVHWAQNLGSEATEVYAVFTPPFDGKDQRVVG